MANKSKEPRNLTHELIEMLLLPQIGKYKAKMWLTELREGKASLEATVDALRDAPRPQEHVPVPRVTGRVRLRLVVDNTKH